MTGTNSCPEGGSKASYPRHPGIVGGTFALPQAVADSPSREVPDFLRDGLFLTNARSGIRILVDHLRCRRVWVPSYLCPTIIQALDAARVEAAYYPVDAALRVTARSRLHEATEGDLVVLVDYFGFPGDAEAAAEFKQRNCWILEDASQALLTSKRLEGTDFVLYSPRKFVGVPDGGILTAPSARALPKPLLEPPPDTWWLRNLEACIRRREFDAYHVENEWFSWYLQAKKAAPIGAYRMSDVSRRLLACAFDYEEIARRRVRNYQHLLAELGDIALFPELPAGIVPLGFPIRVRERETLRRALFDRRIYPPVHWEIAGVVPETYGTSQDLSRHLLTLLCDQRYGPEEMNRMIEVLYAHRDAW